MAEPVVLIVEDPFIRTYLRTVLTRAGHRTVQAEPRAAAGLMHSSDNPVKVFITNHPEDFREDACDLPLIYTTSCPLPGATDGYPHWRILQKPFQPADLLEAVHDLCTVVT